MSGPAYLPLIFLLKRNSPAFDMEKILSGLAYIFSEAPQI